MTGTRVTGGPSRSPQPAVKAQWARLKVAKRYQAALEKLGRTWGWRVRWDLQGPLVQTREREVKRAPRLLVAERIADAMNAGNPDAYSAVRSWPKQDQYDLGLTRAQIDAEIARHIDSNTITGWWHAFELRVLTARDADLPDLLRAFFSDQVLPKHPHASLWHVAVDPLLDARMGALRAMLSEQEAPELIERTDFIGFPAAKGLMSNAQLGFEAYIEPGLLALSPWLLGVVAPRMGGPVVVIFGTPERGLSRIPSNDLLDLYRTPFKSSDADLPASAVTVAPRGVEAFFVWWIERLNVLFARALDPVEFAAEGGVYDVNRHLALVLSLERFFVCLHTLLASRGRNEFMRQLLLFQMLDMLEGLGLGDFEQLLTARKVEERLAQLKEKLAPDVATIVLPKCEHALAALKNVAKGFYLKERINSEGLRVQQDGGGSQRIALDKAVAQYLRVIRNSAHSFLEKMRSPRHRSLVVAHTGILHDALPDLGFLHAVRLLLEADTVRL